MFKAATYRTLALVLIALAGFTMCSKNEVPSNDNGWENLTGDIPVRFSSNVSEAATKAQLSAGIEFGVFGYLQLGVIGSGTQATWNTSRTPNFMYDEDVRYTGSAYNYAPIKYWPNNEENTLTFWAYCPYDAVNISFKVSGSDANYTNQSAGIPDLQFDNADGDVDLLVSEMESNLSKQSLSESVEFTFHHILSKVHVYIKTSATSGTVQALNVSFKDLVGRGVYHTDPEEFENSGWRSSDLQHDYYYVNPSSDEPVTLTNSYQELGHFLLIPQTLDGSTAQLYVQYQEEGSSPMPCSYNLADAALSQWEPETIYNYYITITPGSPIEFVAEIVPWGNDEGHVYITD